MVPYASNRGEKKSRSSALVPIEIANNLIMNNNDKR